MYCATCGTSSTIRRRVWSLLELDMGFDDTTGPGSRRVAPRGSAALGDQDRPFRARTDRAEVVPAGQQLDAEPRLLGEGRELIGRDQPQPDLADPAPDPAALRRRL